VTDFVHPNRWTDLSIDCDHCRGDSDMDVKQHSAWMTKNDDDPREKRSYESIIDGNVENLVTPTDYGSTRWCYQTHVTTTTSK